MDNNIENNSDNSDITFVDTYKCVNKKTLLGSFDIIDLFRKNTDDAGDTNNINNTDENKNTNKMTILLISNDDSSKILETLKEIICDFYYG